MESWDAEATVGSKGSETKKKDGGVEDKTLD